MDKLPKMPRFRGTCLVALALGLALEVALASASQPEIQRAFPHYVKSPLAGTQFSSEQLGAVLVVASGNKSTPTSQWKSPAGDQDIVVPATADPIEPPAAPVETRGLPPGKLAAGAHFRKPQSAGRNLAGQVFESDRVAASTNTSQIGGCLYDKRYFSRMDECLARRPYPTVGLPAFKNEDLLVKRGLSERSGCSFVLSNGLFKSFQVNRYSVVSDNSCLDGTKTGLSLQLNNITMSYLWQLRCLNKADQLLDDATLDGKTADIHDAPLEGGQQQVCVGSSQSFGFASLQLSSIEAQIEMATDIYKNWRITNVTVAMQGPPPSGSTARGPDASQPAAQANLASGGDSLPFSTSTSIKDYVFETLDGDELNWRYQHLYQNWSRNRMHSNFLDQFRRFLWISLQRCLSETSETLPTKLMDIFVNQKYH